MAAPNVSRRFDPLNPRKRAGATRAGMTAIDPAGATAATAWAKTGRKESLRRLKPSTGDRGVMKRSRADTWNQLSFRWAGLALLADESPETSILPRKAACIAEPHQTVVRAFS
ncbi:hypothetical protein SAT01_40620 [Sinomonas atrocyanea]|nr:hypothetical protein SAT01_40620 [Sinomonas atrocyanea]GGG67851.1 hypothetical protein GCM10007172_19640 [Sinomonas atrocyanea]